MQSLVPAISPAYRGTPVPATINLDAYKKLSVPMPPILVCEMGLMFIGASTFPPGAGAVGSVQALANWSAKPTIVPNTITPAQYPIFLDNIFVFFIYPVK